MKQLNKRGAILTGEVFIRTCIGNEGGNPYPPHSGARYQRYRCSLPGLTGLALSRREGTDTGHHGNLRQ